MIRKIKIILEMIKFEHTIFALPFAIMSAFLASNGFPKAQKLLWILTAMIGARSCAMAFNRLADFEYDKLNPRTKNRALPMGLISKKAVWIFNIFMAGILIFSAYMLNPLAFALSPLAILIITGYSYSKRFTSISHFWLGFSLAIAPVGTWIAIKSEFALISLLLGVAVLLWTAGFDIIYGCQDVDFDKKYKLYSIPKKIGIRSALAISSALHIVMIILLISLPLYAPELNYIYYLGVAIVAAILFYEHSIVKPHDLSRVNLAFFTLNGAVSMILMVLAVVDVMI